MKTKLIPVMALSLMGIFATASFAQEESAPAAEEAVIQEVVADNASEKVAKADKEDPRADRAKERFERKDAKKAAIAEHKAEKDAFAKRQRQAENKAEALSNYLMSALSGEKFSSNRCSVSFRHTQKVSLDEGFTIYDIDTHFVRMKEPELDKAAIKKALEDGNTIAGVHMEDGLSMTIR